MVSNLTLSRDRISPCHSAYEFYDGADTAARMVRIPHILLITSKSIDTTRGGSITLWSWVRTRTERSLPWPARKTWRENMSESQITGWLMSFLKFAEWLPSTSILHITSSPILRLLSMCILRPKHVTSLINSPCTSICPRGPVQSNTH